MSAKKGATIDWLVTVRSNGVETKSGASNVTFPLLLMKTASCCCPKKFTVNPIDCGTEGSEVQRSEGWTEGSPSSHGNSALLLKPADRRMAIVAGCATAATAQRSRQ